MNVKEKLKIIYNCLNNDYIILPNGFCVYIAYDDIVINDSNNEYIDHYNISFYYIIFDEKIPLINDIFYYTIIKFLTYEEVKELIDITETDYILERLKL
jgi:hypothetical protein